MADPTYLPQTAAPDTLSDSEQELAAAAAAASSSPSGAAVKQQQVYIWNDKFAVSVQCCACTVCLVPRMLLDVNTMQL